MRGAHIHLARKKMMEMLVYGPNVFLGKLGQEQRDRSLLSSFRNSRVGGVYVKVA